MVAMTGELQDEYRRRYGGSVGDAAPIGPGDFVPPGGLFLVAYAEDRPAGMGGWRRGGPAGEHDGELKRMYVRPSFRGRGYARLLLGELERSAAEAGLTRLVLETGLQQPEAVALYRTHGYADIEPFGFYAGYDDSLHLANDLTRRARDA